MMNDNPHIPSGYKSSPLGIIPEDWEVKRLGEITTKIGSGITPRGGQNVYVTNGRPFMRSQNVSNGRLLLDDIVYIDDSTHQKQISTEIKPYDVLLNITGASIGRCAVAEESIIGGNVNQHVCIIRLKNKNLSYYVCSFLLSHLGQKQVDSFQAGGNREGLNYDQISSFKICVPPLNEIDQITNILSLWDTAIAKQTTLIEQLTLRKHGLMQQLLTGKKRLKGFEEGSFHRLGNYISECNRRNNGCKRVLSVTNTRGFILQEEQFDKIVASNDTSNYKVVRRGEFAYNPSRVNVGSLAMLNEYDEGILSPMYIVFKANENIDKSYLLQCLQSWWFRGHIPAYTQGSVRDSLSFDGLCSMKFYIPTLQEQKAISAILERADKEIEIQKQKLTALQEQKKGLMQVLLTGKKRITTI